uniref:Uncharacterized protein n=1 Tax=Rhizophora mucronata TaxID=61149 RepID=A0A2P2QMZ5_RHIMU
MLQLSSRSLEVVCVLKCLLRAQQCQKTNTIHCIAITIILGYKSIRRKQGEKKKKKKHMTLHMNMKSKILALSWQ